MNKLLQALYHGRIPGWDSQIHSAKTDEHHERILNERKYYTSKMSHAELERYKKLEALYAECHARRYENVYINAFKLGVMLMCAVFTDDDDKEW